MKKLSLLILSLFVVGCSEKFAMSDMQFVEWQKQQQNQQNNDGDDDDGDGDLSPPPSDPVGDYVCVDFDAPSDDFRARVQIYSPVVGSLYFSSGYLKINTQTSVTFTWAEAPSEYYKLKNKHYNGSWIGSFIDSAQNHATHSETKSIPSGSKFATVIYKNSTEYHSTSGGASYFDYGDIQSTPCLDDF